MRYLITVSLLLLTLTACIKKDKEENPYARYDGSLFATRNGVTIKYRMGAYYDSTDSKNHVTLLIADYHSGITWDHIIIGNTLTAPGNYNIFLYQDWYKNTGAEIKNLPFVSYSASFNSGGWDDIPTSHYLGDEPKASINISTYDRDIDEISGTFQLAFLLDKSNKNNPYKAIDSVIYRNATFSVKIHDKAYFDF